MISSMTGFARRIVETKWGVIQWEARSLNHRGLDMSLRLPDAFVSLEADCRRLLTKNFSRGRIDITLRLDKSTATLGAKELNVGAVNELLSYMDSIKELAPDVSSLSVIDILKWPDALKSSEMESTELDRVILDAFGDLISELEKDRLREGDQIQTLLIEKISELKKCEKQMLGMVATAQEAERERLTRKLKEIESEVDPDRVAQEIAIALMKGDVSEEVDRFRLHAQELERVLLEEELAGKRLGFVLQELGREVNTISSKSAYFPLATMLVDMKVVLEQIREQIQNIA